MRYLPLKYLKTCLCLSLGVILLAGCATSPPRDMDNLCSIFKEKREWHKDAKRASKAWGSPIPTIMAFIHQESRFVGNAKPPRTKILWVFPGPRKSSAYGFSQAKKATWRWYQQSSGNGFADRDDFGDAADFVAWYNAQSHKRNGIKPTDTYSLYLAYHEGHGGFTKRTFAKKAWLKKVARKVDARAKKYAAQYQGCKKELNKKRWLFF